jgi:hypothetical protein
MGKAKRKKDTDWFDKFVAANTPGMLAAHLVESGDLPRLFASTGPMNVALARCVDGWIAQVRRGDRPLCLIPLPYQIDLTM